MTIVLVAFLVLILLGLATFTRVETQVAENAQNLAKARQHAMFALNIALGELQRATGPDQRTTVTADMGTVGDGDATTPDNGLPAATDGTFAWTAALGNSANPVNPIDARKAAHTAETPAVLNWLVSGNEGAAFTASLDASSFGQITATPPASGAGSIRFGPNSTVTGLSASTRVSSNLTITAADGVTTRPAALLVGPGSVSNSVNPSAPQANYVVAPLVDIVAPAGSVPGLAATATPVLGCYAWWVGDEGVKARVNLDDPNKAATTGGDALLRTLVAARAGTEVVGAAVLPNGNLSGGFSGVDIASSTLSQVISDNQLAFLNGVTTDVMKARFHDVTPFSAGVLANVATGGLKKDLSAGLLGATQPPEIADGEPLFTAPASSPSNGSNANEAASIPYSSSNLSSLRTPRWSVTAPNTTSASSGPQAWPNWGKIRSYVRSESLVGSGSGAVAPRVGGDGVMAIHPIVTRFQVFIIAFPEDNDGGLSPKARVAYLPAVVLWNPYDRPLGGASYGFYYEADYTPFTGATIPTAEWPSASPYYTGGVPQWPVFTAIHSPGDANTRLVFPGYGGPGTPANPNPNPFDPSDPEVLANRRALQGKRFVSDHMGGRKGLRFVVESPTIQPGEAIVFTPSATTTLSANPRGNVLREGWRVAAFTERFSLGIPSVDRIRYVTGTWPIQMRRYQRFSYGLGGDFVSGPGGIADQIPANLLQTISGVSSRDHAVLDSQRNARLSRQVRYDLAGNDPLREPLTDVEPLAANGCSTWVGPGANLVSNNTGPHTTRIPNWDPDWDNAEMDLIQTSAAVPPTSALHYVFRLEPALPHTEVRPAVNGSEGAPNASTAQRWLGSLNPFAPRLGRTLVDAGGGGYVGNPNFAHQGIIDYHGDSFTTHQPTKFRIPTWDPSAAFPGGRRTFVGSSSAHVRDPSNPVDMVESSRTLIVRHLPDETNSTLSIGALKHADLHPTTGQLHAPPAGPSSTVPLGYASNAMPAQAVGNSLIDPMVNSADVDGFPNNWNNTNSTTLNSEARWLRTHFDLSLVANRALWDRYYFSGVPRSGSIRSRNPRLISYDPDGLLAAGNTAAIAELRAFDTAAARQLVQGSFNINSTSREAWRAMLSAMRDAAVPGATLSPGTTPLLRTNLVSGSAFQASIPASPAMPSSLIHQSERFRALTDAQINALAAEIVDEIRRRGPALTLAGFVNRKPSAEGDPESSDALSRQQGFQRYVGPVQTAIDRVSAYSTTSGEVRTFSGINDNLMYEIRLNTDTANSSNSIDDGRVPHHVNFSRMAAGAHREVNSGANGVNTTGSSFIIADAPLSLRTRAFGMPGYLTQSDIFQVLGPSLSARSDTFRIRTYGEVRDPLSGDLLSRAWIEAVVQRLPEFVNSADSAEKWRPNASAAAASSWNPSLTHNPENLQFGRRYRVVSFRWLGPDDV